MFGEIRLLFRQLGGKKEGRTAGRKAGSARKRITRQGRARDSVAEKQTTRVNCIMAGRKHDCCSDGRVN